MTDRVLFVAGERARPYKDAILELFTRLKSSRVDVQGMGRSLQKEKWDDLTYFLAQDYWMARLEKDTNKAVFSLAVMGFVRGDGGEARTRVGRARARLSCIMSSPSRVGAVTCSRSGSMGRDWFDRAGLTLLWIGRSGHRGIEARSRVGLAAAVFAWLSDGAGLGSRAATDVLSVGDFTWDTEHFVITLPEVEAEAAAAKEVEVATSSEASEASETTEEAIAAACDRAARAIGGRVEAALRGEVVVCKKVV